MQDIGFDIISDLNLDPNESFNWENKRTSLYCIVAGNISSNTRTITQVLAHLSTFYQGVFYVAGELEFQTSSSIPDRIKELSDICDSIPGVCLMHQKVAVINGIAVLGANGWSEAGKLTPTGMLVKNASRNDDIAYLTKSIAKLQRHLDIKNIVVVTNAVPRDDLYFGETPTYDVGQTPLHESLDVDTEHKVTHWVFGTYNKPSDTFIDTINYVNNPYERRTTYWPKRITISV